MGIIPIRQLGDEAIRIGLDTRIFDELEFLFFRRVLVGGTNKTVSDVFLDGRGKENWFLGHKTNLSAKPFQIEVAASSSKKMVIMYL